MNVGYIGLGAMGGALARHLLKSHQLSVWDINPAALAAFDKLGATVAPTAAALARQCQVVVLCLPRSSDVQQLIFGPDGLAQGLAAGALVIDQTSGFPSETRRIAQQLAERGVAMLDAPVSGGVSAANAGTISIMASGPDAAYEQALPVLRAISPNVYRCGARVGDGQAMKLVNNVLSAGCRLATLEVVAMGRKMGLSLQAMTDVINKGSGRNRTSKLMLQNMVDGKTTTTSFAMALMLKDMNQAMALGMETGAPMALTSIVRGLLQIGVNTMGEAAQLDRVLDLVESLAGTRISDEAAAASPVSPAAPAALAVPAAPGAALTPAAGHDASALRVGFVGLGAMGGALVRRMMLSRKMTVFDARPEVVREFEAEGAIGASDLATLARDCDVIMICVPTSAIVREVVFGPGGLAQGLAPGKIVVDQTTGDPTLTRAIGADLQKLGVALVDAPVSGGPRGAVAGTIAIMCGGPAAAYAQVLPLLQSVSPNSVYCGETGNGHAAKLINNAVASCNRLLTYEATAMGFKYGLSLADMATVINQSTGWNGASERILPVLAQYGQTSNFQLSLMVKDLKLAAQMAISCGAPMLIANAVRSLFEVGAQAQGGHANLDAIAHLFEAMAGIRFSDARQANT